MSHLGDRLVAVRNCASNQSTDYPRLVGTGGLQSCMGDRYTRTEFAHLSSYQVVRASSILQYFVSTSATGIRSVGFSAVSLRIRAILARLGGRLHLWLLALLTVPYAGPPGFDPHLSDSARNLSYTTPDRREDRASGFRRQSDNTSVVSISKLN